ncbi:hypothetical protein ET532_021670, partial [Verminephrobacter sp. Larva24]
VGLRWPSKRIAALHRLPIRSVLAVRCALRCAPMAARSLRHLIGDATLAADAVPLDFTVTYEILSPSGDKIGSYATSVRGPESPTGSTYELSGKFELSFKKLMLFNYEYSSVDSASHDESGIKSYQIVEIENGKRTLVTGSRSSDKERLQIIEKLDRDSAKYASTVVMNSTYDYSLFAFRFPSPCTNHPIGSTRELRILTPRTGQVSTVRSESVAVDDPKSTAKCRLITRDKSNKVVKESYFLADGILAFEKTPDYQMRRTGVQRGSRK